LLTVACAGRPPVSRSVNNWIAGSLRMILIDKRVDPGDHLGLREAVTFIAAIGVVLHVQSPRKGLAVLGPAASVLDEVASLHSAGSRVGTGEVIGAADHAYVV
jgi:hypothetical protein